MNKCAWVENMMSVETDGWSRACCLEPSIHARISPIKDGIQNAFQSPILLKLRKDLESGFSVDTRPYCGRCEYMENNGQPSMRTSIKQISPERELKLLQFKMSNRCQLTCAHCGPELSSGWAKFNNITPHVLSSFNVTDEFLNELKEILPSLSVLKFTGGEPFLDPNHWKILEGLANVDRRHCELQYITNGLIKPRTELWEGWGRVKCSVSADGFGESYDWFRRGASWSELVECVETLKDHSTLSINFSITPFTFQDYHKAKEFWKFPFSTVPIVYPAHANMFSFPREIADTIPDSQSIPGYQHTTSPGNIEVYKIWANEWDRRWNTIGWAEKLFTWV